MRCFPSIIPLFFVASPVFAAVREIWWNITYVHNANPDGLFDRRVIGVNGVWPPPPIEINSTDSLLLHATNLLDQPTTLHHHGMFFNSTSWMDGALAVTQCGIPPGATFDYVVPIDTSGQWGTYWVHAHSYGQYVDGLRSPLIIHAAQEVHTYDDEYTVVLGDWYHKEHDILMQKFISISNPGGAEPVPNSGLIYFAHNSTYLPPVAGSTPSRVTSAVGFNENATLPFVPGRTYRLRIINTSALSAFFFWIDGHDMRIIEADGTDVAPYSVDAVSIAVAQRYSVLVTARNDTSTNWAIHANMDTEMFDEIPPGLNPNATAAVTYNTSAPLKDLGVVSAYKELNDTLLVPIPAIPQLPRATKTIELEVIFETMDDGTNRGTFNRVVYNPPFVPAVLSELSLGPNATAASAYGPMSFVVDESDVIDIVLKNGDAGKHPFHLHGHKVALVHRAEDFTSDDPTLNPPLVEGQINPMRRDTVAVGSMGSITMRFVADNPGVWLFHCHIEWHLQSGLALQLVEAPLLAQQRNTIPQQVYDQCRALGLPTSGNAAGHASPTDLSGLRFGPYPQQLGWHPKGIGAMAGCVLSAVIGMAAVVWYALGGHISEEEMEREVRERLEARERRGRFFGLLSLKK